MDNQLDIFKESKKKSYKEFYDDFYKGVKERYEKERRDEESNKHEWISIRIKNK